MGNWLCKNETVIISLAIFPLILLCLYSNGTTLYQYKIGKKVIQSKYAIEEYKIQSAMIN